VLLVNKLERRLLVKPSFILLATAFCYYLKSLWLSEQSEVTFYCFKLPPATCLKAKREASRCHEQNTTSKLAGLISQHSI